MAIVTFVVAVGPLAKVTILLGPLAQVTILNKIVTFAAVARRIVTFVVAGGPLAGGPAVLTAGNHKRPGPSGTSSI